MRMFSNLGKVEGALTGKNWSEFMRGKGLDIIEKGVLETMLMTFDGNWDLSSHDRPSPLGSGKSYRRVSDVEGTSISIDSIRAQFRHNPLISNPVVLVHESLTLPPASTISAHLDKDARVIEISSPVAETCIRIWPYMGVVVQRGVWGVIEPDSTDMNRYATISYEVDLKMQTRLLHTHDPQMEAYRRWFEILSGALREYHWSVVEGNIERARLRESSDKVLTDESE